jgi:cytidylate kinase
MAIVTISSELGARGAEIGQGVAESLRYGYADREVITEAARRFGLEEARLELLEENKPSFFDRVDAERQLYIAGTKAALLEFARRDNVVLMGRGGQWLLRQIPHALHVRLTASFEVRLARLAQSLEGTGRVPSSRSLVGVVERDDAGRLGRLRYLYGVDIRDPALYDIVVNTTLVPAAAAVDLIVTLLGQPEFATTAEGQTIVADRTLASTVEVALARDLGSWRRRLSVSAAGGVVTIGGVTERERAVKIAQGVSGVTEVRLV